MTQDIEKLKQSAEHFKLNDCPIIVNPLSLLELIATLKETKADLAHANSILIKVENLLEGVDYSGDYSEGVRVLKDSLEVAEKDAIRYQFLRDNPDFQIEYTGNLTLDEHVDLGMAAARRGE